MRQFIEKNKTDEVVYLQGDTPARKFPIDFNDRVQVLYEMIRKASLSQKPVEDVCKEFGYSRQAYYYNYDKFMEDGILGLQKDKPGPKEPTKRTEELEKRIIELRFNRPSLNMYEINEIITEEGYDVSPTTISRVLNEHGLTKKKRKKRS